MKDHAQKERRLFVRASAGKHNRIVDLFRELNTPEWRGELLAIFVAGLILGEFLGRMK